jgi:copper chaperone CopZ
MRAFTIVLIHFTFLSSCKDKTTVPHARVVTVKVFGNCNMCKKTIEKAGTMGATSVTEWDKSIKMATITYDSTQTSLDKVLEEIAFAGYDSQKFKAPKNIYDALPGCCQYERELPQ